MGRYIYMDVYTHTHTLVTQVRLPSIETVWCGVCVCICSSDKEGGGDALEFSFVETSTRLKTIDGLRKTSKSLLEIKRNAPSPDVE